MKAELYTIGINDFRLLEDEQIKQLWRDHQEEIELKREQTDPKDRVKCGGKYWK